MSKKKTSPPTKRPSKGLRTHVRRMKQEAHQAGVVYRPEILQYA